MLLSKQNFKSMTPQIIVFWKSGTVLRTPGRRSASLIPQSTERLPSDASNAPRNYQPQSEPHRPLHHQKTITHPAHVTSSHFLSSFFTNSPCRHQAWAGSRQGGRREAHMTSFSPPRGASDTHGRRSSDYTTETVGVV